MRSQDCSNFFLQFTYIVIIELCTWLGPRDFINLNYYFYLRFNFSGVLIAAYLVYYLRVRSNDALRYVRLKRPGAVQTRRQIECVKEFEAYFLPQVSKKIREIDLSLYFIKNFVKFHEIFVKYRNSCIYFLKRPWENVQWILARWKIFVKLIYSCISQNFREISRNFCEIYRNKSISCLYIFS